VEDGRGSLGPMATTPFPSPLIEPTCGVIASGSPTGFTKAHSGAGAQHTAVPMDLIVCEPAVAAPCHLVPSGEEAAHALTTVVIETAERCHRRPQIEVARPTPEDPAQILAHFGPGIIVTRH